MRKGTVGAVFGALLLMIAIAFTIAPSASGQGGPFGAQIENFWNLISTGGRTFTTIVVKAGNGTATQKTGGVICSSLSATCGCTAFVDASVQNQWNTMTCTLPASTLLNVGDEIEIDVDFRLSTASDARNWQLMWNGGTCGSGSGSAPCTTGTAVYSLSTSTASLYNSTRTRVMKTASSGQRIQDFAVISPTTINDIVQLSTSTTDTGPIIVAFGIRDTASSSASVNPTFPPIMRIWYYGQ